jgi:D-amino-acid oxidase
VVPVPRAALRPGLPLGGLSYQRFVAISREEPEAGVDVRSGVELLTSPAPGPPWWHDAVPHLERLPAGERPAGYADGWRLEVPVVDMSRYLPWLTGRLEALGATITRHWLHALPDGPDAPLVVNCTGIAARALADDRSLHPVRGQVVVVGQVGIRTWTLAQDDPARPTYVVPRRDTVVVGGTAVEGAWDRTPDLALARELLARATVLEPRLAAAPVLGHRVGLRPARPSVRLEAERRHDGGAVVHCYGHGGAGVTLSWGCAEDVAAEVQALVGA